MQIYLPIAEIPIDIIIILLIGFLAGFMAGIFGIGGGFISTPLLILIGIPSAVAVSTATNQIIASSVSGLLAHVRKGGVDIKMGCYLLIGGVVGSSVGVVIFRFLQNSGYIDVSVGVLYVLLLGSIGSIMMIDVTKSFIERKYNISFRKKESVILRKVLRTISNLPYKTHFPKSKITISVIAPMVIGGLIGIIVSLIGVGGGFILIPAMIYLLRMPSNVVIGTSLFQIVFVASNATFLQAITNHTIDIVLALLMIVSSAIGAQIGSNTGYKSDADKLRFMLALLILGVCFKMLFGLLTPPEHLYSLEVIENIVK